MSIKDYKDQIEHLEYIKTTFKKKTAILKIAHDIEVLKQAQKELDERNNRS